MRVEQIDGKQIQFQKLITKESHPQVVSLFWLASNLKGAMAEVMANQ